MKKNLFLLVMACTASVAYAESADIAPITLTPEISDFTRFGNYTGDNVNETTTYASGFTVPEANVGSSRYWTWTTDFTLTETFTIDTIQAKLFTCTGNGGTQVGDRAGWYTLTIMDSTGQVVAGGNTAEDRVLVTFTGAGGTTTSAVTATADYATGTVSSGSGAVVSYGIDTILAAGDYTMELTVHRADGETRGYFVGVQDARINLSAVPEPATATLSLLALAGLAARRRRK